MALPTQWFSQVSAITKFGLMSIPQRRGSVGAAAFGIAGVVAVLVGVLSIAAGFGRALRHRCRSRARRAPQATARRALPVS